ncbi:MAG: sigma-70 family RNA polymerase sigma factor [Candidatus Latescibacterota bacterium]|nr:MAG: sigma-70 family RNA polymerase sigma factor [Candidatus Latescibacterota bacterium]
MHEDERELIKRWKQGDKKAFGALVRRYMTDAYLIALGFAGNPDDARDLSQDAFIKAYQARDQFDPERPFYPWFYRILRNRCLNFVQRESRKTEPLYYDNSPDRERFASGTPSPLEGLEQDERKRLLYAAIEKLSFEHKEIIVLKNFKGYSYDSIAKVLNIPMGTVMSRLYYARKMLRRILIELEQHGVTENADMIPDAQAAPGEVV